MVVYDLGMKRIQVYVDEELDEALQAEAARSGRSKAALVRECVAGRFRKLQPLDKDPLTALAGTIEAEPADIDEVVYGR